VLALLGTQEIEGSIAHLERSNIMPAVAVHMRLEPDRLLVDRCEVPCVLAEYCRQRNVSHITAPTMWWATCSERPMLEVEVGAFLRALGVQGRVLVVGGASHPVGMSTRSRGQIVALFTRGYSPKGDATPIAHHQVGHFLCG